MFLVFVLFSSMFISTVILVDRKLRQTEALRTGMPDFASTSVGAYLGLSLIASSLVLPIYFWSSRRVSGVSKGDAALAAFGGLALGLACNVGAAFLTAIVIVALHAA